MSSEVAELLKEVLRKIEEIEKRRRESEQPHDHVVVKGSQGYFCKDCGTRFIEDRGFDLAVDILRRQHGHSDSFLDCPTCRPKLFEVLRSQGWDVDDRGREIVIRKRK